MYISRIEIERFFVFSKREREREFVVDVGDQVRGFAVAKVPLEREF